MGKIVGDHAEADEVNTRRISRVLSSRARPLIAMGQQDGIGKPNKTARVEHGKVRLVSGA